MDFTCVEIKNVKYIKLLSLDQIGEKHLDLTTIHKDQELAFLKIFLIDKNKNKKLLKNIQINNVRPGNSGIPELQLSVFYDGKRYYKIVIKLNGFIYHNSIIDIRHFQSGKMKISSIALIAAAILILSFLSFFSIKTFTSYRDINRVSDSYSKTSSANSVDQTGVDPTVTKQVAEEQVTEQQVTEQQVTEQQVAEQQVAEQQATEQQVAEQQVAEQQVAEEQVTEQQVAEQQVTEQQNVIVHEEKILSELTEDKAIVYFNPDSSVLSNDAISVLNQVLEILKSQENPDVEISGHCAFFGTEKGRQEISTERAQNVYLFFKNNGWTPDEEPELSGLGYEMNITKDPAKQNLNRRVEILIKHKT